MYRTSLPVFLTLVSPALAQAPKIPAQVPTEPTGPTPVVKTDAEDLGAPTPHATAGRAPVAAPTAALDLRSVYAGRVGHDVDEQGTLWARGESYKASFDAAGATYVPFLGSRAPRNFPVTFRTTSVESGAASLEFDATARPERAGDVVTFARGACEESYVLAPTGVEQTFTFRDAPRDADLTVSLDVATDFEALDLGHGLRFENEFGHVDYSGAFLVDARGLRTEIPTRLVGEHVELTVPRSLLAASTFPITIDPVISTFALDTDADTDSNPDVATDATAATFLFVYEFAFSATDHDIVWIETTDQVVTGSGNYEVSTADWRKPAIANNNLANQFLVVAEVGTAPNRVIRGRQMDATTNLLTPAFTISGAESGDKHDADVGGDPILLGPTYYCVVWQRELSSTNSDIHYRMVTSAAGFQTGVVFLENTVARNDRLPTISKSDGLEPSTTQAWQIAWQYEFSAADEDIYGARVRWDGLIVDAPFGLATSTANQTDPGTSAPLNDSVIGRPWLVGYTEVTGNGQDVMLRAYNGNLFLSGLDLSNFGTASAEDESSPQFDIDGSQFMLVYQRATSVGLGFGSSLYAATVYLQSSSVLSISETELPISTSLIAFNASARMASTHSGGWNNPYRSNVAFRRSSLLAGTSDIYTGVYDSPLLAGKTEYCFGTAFGCPCANAGDPTHGCANSSNALGARLDVAGIANVSGDSFRMVGSGMPPTATCLYFQGSSQVPPVLFGDGIRCIGGTLIRLGIKTNSAGISSYPGIGDASVSVKGQIPSAGARRGYQCWYRDSVSFCTAQSFNLTQAVQVYWLP